LQAEPFNPPLVEGDGNCLFRAVSVCLFATERHHQIIRERVGRFLNF
jgi:hypothetical protein